MTVTVCVYLLFLYDQWYKEGTWEMLDDSVYYVKVRTCQLSVTTNSS